jgi:hypothetical protein
VKPECKTGYHEDTGIKAQHPGVCGLGICCVPDSVDCRTTGCGANARCDACLGPNGPVYVCIGNGAAC